MGEESSTLKQLIEDELLPSALRCGINLFDFWEMTVKEVKVVVEAYTENKKLEAKITKINTYNNAYLTALFVGKALAGKKIPSIDEIFPDTAEDVQKSEPKVDNSWLIMKEKMIDFANEANKRRNRR